MPFYAGRRYNNAPNQTHGIASALLSNALLIRGVADLTNIDILTAVFVCVAVTVLCRTLLGVPRANARDRKSVV